MEDLASSTIGVSQAPPVRKGWLRKQDRKGLIKNWKTRYVTLIEGKLLYYTSESPEPPFGLGLKGELNLEDTEITVSDINGDNLKDSSVGEGRIFITSFNGENNLLVEAPTAKEALDWSSHIQAHINFANVQAANSAASGTTSKSEKRHLSIFRRRSDCSESTRPLSFAGRRENSAANVSSNTRSDESSETNNVSDNEPVATNASNEDAATASSIGSDQSKVDNIFTALDTLATVVVRTAQEPEYRKTLFEKIPLTAKLVATSCWENTQAGEVGKRGEDLVASSIIIMLMIIFGVISGLNWLIFVLLKLGSTIFVSGGLMMIINAMWELNENMSLLLPPAPKHKLVRSGVYNVVRHPMYGGIILVAFGFAIVQDRMYKAILAIALAMILDKAAEREEEYLEKLYPRDYVAYSSNKKALVPFLY